MKINFNFKQGTGSDTHMTAQFTISAQISEAAQILLYPVTSA